MSTQHDGYKPMDTSAREKSDENRAANGCAPKRATSFGGPKHLDTLDAAEADRYARAFLPSWAPLDPELAERSQSATTQRTRQLDLTGDPLSAGEIAIAGRRQRARNVFNAGLALAVFGGLGYWAIDDMFLRANQSGTVPATAADDPLLALAAEQDFAADPTPPDTEPSSLREPTAVQPEQRDAVDPTKVETAFGAATHTGDSEAVANAPDHAPDTVAVDTRATSPEGEHADEATASAHDLAVAGPTVLQPTAAADSANAGVATAAGKPAQAAAPSAAAAGATLAVAMNSENVHAPVATAAAATTALAAPGPLATAASTSPVLAPKPAANSKSAAPSEARTRSTNGPRSDTATAAPTTAADAIPEPPQTPTRDTPSTQPEEVTRQRVRSPLVIVRALPERSKLWLDGQRMANPFDVRLPRGSTHTIDARSEGYEPMSQTMRVESDAKLTITLRRVTPAPETAAAPRTDKPLATRTEAAGFVTKNPY